MPTLETVLQQVVTLSSSGALARRAGEERVAEQYFRGAFGLASDAARQTDGTVSAAQRLEILRTAARLALDCGEVAEARRLMQEALEATAPEAAADWAQLRDVSAWPDEWLLAAVRRDPPDAEALDELAHRYWQPAYARCRLLTMDADKARDLTQEAWRRVLRARQSLKPGGNFLSYLTTAAHNLWRDQHRTALRAGPMADNRLASLEADCATSDGQSVRLAEILPDLNALEADAQKRLRLDLDQALQQLDPIRREVLVARFLNGESCADIGRRHGRTEQTISSWVRQAVQQM
ncbi:MAG: sigma-70 family RNA polymerase sigma factor, partial [Pseudomonadota bacterium]